MCVSVFFLFMEQRTSIASAADVGKKNAIKCFRFFFSPLSQAKAKANEVGRDKQCVYPVIKCNLADEIR